MKLYGTVVDNNDPTKNARLKVSIFGMDDNVVVEDLGWLESKSNILNSSFSLPNNGEIVTLESTDDGVGNDRIYAWSHLDFVDKGLIDGLVGDDYLKTVTLFYKNLSAWGSDGATSILWTMREGLRMIADKGMLQIRKDNSVLLSSDGVKIHIKKGHISLSQEDKSNEPAVLGDKNIEALTSLNDVTHKHWSNMHTMLSELASACASNPITATLTVPITKFIATEITNMLKNQKQSQIKIDKTPSKAVSLD